MPQLLFLCTGNYYRSRFAEIFFNWQAEQRQSAWRAESRGLEPHFSNPGPLSRHTREACRHLGIDIEPYVRMPLAVTEDDFLRSHHVVAVKAAEHRALMQSLFPAWVERIEYWHVHDLDCAGPEDTIPHLQREVLALLERLPTAGV